MFVQETDLVFLLCLQAFKEMLYAAQDQAPSIEGIACMHTVMQLPVSCTFSSLTYQSCCCLALYWKLLCYHVGVRPRVLHVDICATAEHGPNPTIPKY